MRIGNCERLLRATERRYAREVELAVVEIGHLREALAERIEPEHASVHLAEAQRQRIEILRDRLSRRLERSLLLLEITAPDVHLRLGMRNTEMGGCLESRVEKAAAKHECQRDDAHPYATGPEAHMPNVALTLR